MIPAATIPPTAPPTIAPIGVEDPPPSSVGRLHVPRLRPEVISLETCEEVPVESVTRTVSGKGQCDATMWWRIMKTHD